MTIKAEHGGPKHGKGPGKKGDVKQMAKKARRGMTDAELDAYCDKIRAENPSIFARLAIDD